MRRKWRKTRGAGVRNCGCWKSSIDGSVSGDRADLIQLTEFRYGAESKISFDRSSVWTGREGGGGVFADWRRRHRLCLAEGSDFAFGPADQVQRIATDDFA